MPRHRSKSIERELRSATGSAIPFPRLRGEGQNRRRRRSTLRKASAAPGFTHYSLLTTHYSLLTTHYSLLLRGSSANNRDANSRNSSSPRAAALRRPTVGR